MGICFIITPQGRDSSAVTMVSLTMWMDGHHNIAYNFKQFPFLHLDEAFDVLGHQSYVRKVTHTCPPVDTSGQRKTSRSLSPIRT